MSLVNARAEGPVEAREQPGATTRTGSQNTRVTAHR